MNKDKYETASLPLASTIVSSGITLESIKRNVNGKVIFIFAETPHLQKLINSFWNRELKVEPNAFWEAQRFLKSRIYGE